MEASHKTHRPHMKVGKDEEKKKIAYKTVLLISLAAHGIDQHTVSSDYPGSWECSPRWDWECSPSHAPDRPAPDGVPHT